MGFSLDADLNCCCGCCLGLAIGYLIFSETIFDEAAKELVGHVTESQADNFLLRQIDVYQRNIGPEIKEVMGVEKICRYDPTCSEYARVAIEKYGSLKGSAMAANRLLRCNPLSKGGDDPVV